MAKYLLATLNKQFGYVPVKAGPRHFKFIKREEKS
jgi:hypothetical protein